MLRQVLQGLRSRGGAGGNERSQSRERIQGNQGTIGPKSFVQLFIRDEDPDPLIFGPLDPVLF